MAVILPIISRSYSVPDEAVDDFTSLRYSYSSYPIVQLLVELPPSQFSYGDVNPTGKNVDESSDIEIFCKSGNSTFVRL